MKKWSELDALERFRMMEACDKSFHPTEDTTARLEYVESIYNLIYDMQVKTRMSETSTVTKAEFEEFKVNLKTYLGRTDDLIKELTKVYDILSGDYKNLREAMDLLDRKIDIIAESEGLSEKETVQ